MCEVASQLLGHQDVMTIFVADMSTVAVSAEIKYSQLETFSSLSQGASLSPTLAKGAYGRAYLQKMVQLQFDLPPADLKYLRQMLTTNINTPAKAHDNEPSPRYAGKGKPPKDASRDSGKGKTSSKEVRSEKVDNATLVSRIGRWTIALGSLASAVASVLALLPSLSGNKNTKNVSSLLNGAWLLWLVAIVVGIGITSSIIWVVLLNLRRRASQRIDDEIRAHDVGTDDVESLRANVRESEAGLQGVDGLADQRLERFITDDSVLRQQAESEILRFLPQVPRSAKRLANHLRLLLAVAYWRNMLGGAPQLRAAHLGKWMVLLERWPELGFAVRANPSLLANIEKMVRDNPKGLADIDQLSSLGDAELSDATAFFQSRPTLASVAMRLIYCLPASARKLASL